MKRKTKTGSGVYGYLESIGILEHGTPEQIAAARRQYWNDYKRKWKHDKRTAFTVLLSVEESKELARAAKAHHNNPTSFLKQAAFAYIHTSYVVPDIEALQEIRLLLARNYLILQSMDESGSQQSVKESSLQQQFAALERTVLHQLLHPGSIEDCVRKAIATDPTYRQRLLKILQFGSP